MGSFSQGLEDGARLFLDFKRSEREDRYKDAMIEESKQRMEASRLMEERTVNTAKLQAYN